MTQTTLTARLAALDAMVGDTPLLALHFRYRGQNRLLYAKAEYLNLTGSIKDRMVLHVVRRAYAERRISAGDTIVEATSGNTGISLAAIGGALGHPVVIYMPDWMSRERSALIRSMGGQVELISARQGGFIGSIEACEAYARSHRNVFLPRQFSNDDNAAAHETGTGPEIFRQIEKLGLTVDAFVAGVGTGGTVMGVGRHLRRRYPSVRIYPMEPAESPTLTQGCKTGHHRIQGISDEFVPPICRLKELNSVVSVSDGDAILMAQKLAMTMGLGVGVSSGANFIAALIVQNMLAPQATVVSVFCDDNKKYVTTDLFQNEPVKASYYSPEVEFIGYEAVTP